MPSAMDRVFITGQRSVSSTEHAQIRRDPIQWPNGARVAVTWTAIFELFTEPSEVYRTEICKQALYGGRRGVWRLLDQFDRHQIKVSFLINGYAAAKFPEAAQEIRRRGHEIVAYGYTSSKYLSDMTQEEEKFDILKTLDLLEKVTGTRPTGWVSADLLPGDHTLEILAEQGIVWNGDFPNDDLPYTVRVAGKKMVIIPYAKEVDDYEIYGKNLQLPDVFTDYFVDSLDVLQKEGMTHPKMLHATVRCHFFGRAVGTKALDRAIEYSKSQPHVWFASRGDIAQWWMKQNYS